MKVAALYVTLVAIMSVAAALTVPTGLAFGKGNGFVLFCHLIL